MKNKNQWLICNIIWVVVLMIMILGFHNLQVAVDDLKESITECGNELIRISNEANTRLDELEETSIDRIDGIDGRLDKIEGILDDMIEERQEVLADYD